VVAVCAKVQPRMNPNRACASRGTAQRTRRIRDPLATGNDGGGQMMRVKVGTIDRLALLCISVLGAALAVIGGAIALGVGGALLGLGLSMMALAFFYAILG
jgi:hypothetical protein